MAAKILVSDKQPRAASREPRVPSVQDLKQLTLKTLGPSTAMIIPLPLQEALKDSITSGAFVDTKFWVFSKRGSKYGRIGEPRALFANGHVVKGVPRLGSRERVPSCPSSLTNSLMVLDEGGAKDSLEGQVPNRYTNHYDHEEDSDLEEEDDDILDDEPAGRATQVATEKPRNNSDVVVIENSDVKSNEPSDIVFISDLDSLFPEPPDVKGETGTATSAHVGKVVVIEDVAFVT